MAHRASRLRRATVRARAWDLLCLDNYRVFHGREPHTGSDAILHKLWAWSDMAFGLPRPADLIPSPT